MWEMECNDTILHQFVCCRRQKRKLWVYERGNLMHRSIDLCPTLDCIFICCCSVRVCKVLCIFSHNHRPFLNCHCFSFVIEMKFNSCKIIPHYYNNRFALHMHTSTISTLILNTFNTAIHLKTKFMVISSNHNLHFKIH